MTNNEASVALKKAMHSMAKNFTEPSSVTVDDVFGMVDVDPYPNLPTIPDLPEEGPPDVPYEVISIAKQNPLIIMILARVLNIEKATRMMYASILATNRDVYRIKKMLEKIELKNIEEGSH